MLLSEFPFLKDDQIPAFNRGNWGCGVYFVGDVSNTLVKIGRSGNPLYRLRQIRSDLKRPDLKMMAYFRDGSDGKAHRYFAKLRVSGEWFRPTPKMLHAILTELKGCNVRFPRKIFRKSHQFCEPILALRCNVTYSDWLKQAKEAQRETC